MEEFLPSFILVRFVHFIYVTQGVHIPKLYSLKLEEYD